MSLVKLIIVLAIVSLVSGRLSWYFADQAKNYHPPYDKGVNTNSYNGSNPDVCVNTFTCPAGYQVAINASYTPTVTQTCPVPGWITTNDALTQFNGCCLRYYSCLQVCGVNKAFCDGQFYGCAYTSCDPERNLRPGDRVYCRQLSSCMASYLSRGSACSGFNNMQRSACTCQVSTTSNPPSAFAASLSPFQVNPNPVKRQATGESESESAAVVQSQSQSQSAASQTSLPSTTPTQGGAAVASLSTSTSSTPSAFINNGQGSSTPSESAVLPRASLLDYYNNLYAANFGQYFVRPIPIWELYQNRCPPNFENYVAVFTDQEQDDVNYYGQAANSGNSLSSWTQLFSN